MSKPDRVGAAPSMVLDGPLAGRSGAVIRYCMSYLRTYKANGVLVFIAGHSQRLAQQRQGLRLGEFPRLQTPRILIHPFLPRAKSDTNNSRSNTSRCSRVGVEEIKSVPTIAVLLSFAPNVL